MFGPVDFPLLKRLGGTSPDATFGCCGIKLAPDQTLFCCGSEAGWYQIPNMSSLPHYLANKPGGLIPSQLFTACTPVLISGQETYAVTAKQELFGIYKTIKAQLSEPEQARLLYKASLLYEKVYPKSKQGGDHKSAKFKKSKLENQTDTVSFCSHAAKHTGKSERTIRRLKEFGKLLSESDQRGEDQINEQVDAIIRGSGVKAEKSVTQLKSLYKEPAKERLKLAKFVVENDCRSVETAKYMMKREQQKNEITYDFDPTNLKFCDFREFLAGLKDQSVDFLMSDPPYENGHVWVFEELAKEAKRILVPGGYMMLMVGQVNDVFPAAVAAGTKYLYWHDMIACLNDGKTVNVHDRKISAAWKPMLVFRNGKEFGDLRDKAIYRNAITADIPPHDHPHQQALRFFYQPLKALSLPGNLVIDPFLGSGTTGEAALLCGCRFMGCDDGSCNDEGKYDGVGVGNKWVGLAQSRLDAVVKELKKDKPEALISAPLPILGAAEPPLLTA